MPRTSDRHTDILNGYKQGGSRFNEWAYAQLGDLKLLAWSWGHISMEWDVDERFVMPDGVMFGGHTAAVADHVAGLATMTVLMRDEERFRTSRLETSYFRPIREEPVRIEGKVVAASKHLIHVEAAFHDPEDRLAVKIAAVQVRRATG